MFKLTPWDDDPYEVHEEIVTPKIVSLWSAVSETSIIMVKHACRIVENVAIYLSQGNHCLKRMPQWVFDCNEVGNNEA